MAPALADTAIAFVGISLVLLCTLATRRMLLGRRARVYAATERRVRPIAIEMLEAEGSDRPQLSSREQAVLAEVLGLPEGSYDLRSNKGGIAVSGEVTLHGENVYIQASQPVAGSPATGLLIRSCDGRRDFTGGPNHFASLAALDSPKGLADYVLRVSPSVRPDLETPEEGLAPRHYQGR